MQPLAQLFCAQRCHSQCLFIWEHSTTSAWLRRWMEVTTMLVPETPQAQNKDSGLCVGAESPFSLRHLTDSSIHESNEAEPNERDLNSSGYRYQFSSEMHHLVNSQRWCTGIDTVASSKCLSNMRTPRDLCHHRHQLFSDACSRQYTKWPRPSPLLLVERATSL